MKRSTLSHSFLNIFLVFIESALTLLLRLDPELRKAAYPLAKQGTVVALRLYLPHVEVFATFSTKGVLLDAQLPIGRSEPDVVINAYSIQVINAITTHDSESTEKLQMRGESVQVQLVKQFIMQLGLGSLIQGLVKKFKGGKGKSKPTEAEMAGANDSLALVAVRIVFPANVSSNLVPLHVRTVPHLQRRSVADSPWGAPLQEGCG